MSARLKGRRREADAIIRRFAELAAEDPAVRALALVGSYACGTPRMGSDVDLMLLTDQTDTYTRREIWLSAIGHRAELIRTRRWGPTTERRARTPSGLHVELGLAPPSWASTEPLDPGTCRVVTGGMVTLYDPDGLLADLEIACRRATACPRAPSPPG